MFYTIGELAAEVGDTDFLGYHSLIEDCSVLGLAVDGRAEYSRYTFRVRGRILSLFSSIYCVVGYQVN